MIWIESPRGIRPAVSAKRLEGNEAQTARNCDLPEGVWKPVAGLTLEQGLGSLTRTIVKNNDVWLTFSKITDVVKSPVSEQNDRYYYSDASIGPKKKDDSAGPFDLGVANPTDPLAITFEGTALEDAEVKRTVAYVYTRVTAWGEESAPSQPTAAVDLYQGQSVSLTGFSAESGHVTHYRVYRVAAGEVGADYFPLPWQISAGNLQYSGTSVVYDVPRAQAEGIEDDVTDFYLGPDALPTSSWSAAPSTLNGLTDVGNGIMAAFAGKSVRFNEPWYFYAWPAAYGYATDTDVVGIGVFQGQAMVMTLEGVYFFQGTTPDAYAQVRHPENQGCIAKRSIVSTKYGVYFASKDGLCRADSAGVEVITQNTWTREQWLALTPANLVGLYYNGRYHGFFSGSSTGFILDIAGETPSVVTLDLGSYTFYGGYVDPGSDNLFLSLAPYGIYRFDADTGNPLTLTWKSKRYYGPSTNFAAVLLVGEAGSSTVTVLADETEKFSQSLSHNTIHRLPGGFLSRTWEVQVSGTARIDSIGLGYPRELNLKLELEEGVA